MKRRKVMLRDRFLVREALTPKVQEECINLHLSKPTFAEETEKHWVTKRIKQGTDADIGPVLFQDVFRPINNPLLFMNQDYLPNFGPQRVPINATLIMSMEEVRSLCVDNPQCKYDYLMTGRREIAANTLSMHNRFLQLRRMGSRLRK